MAASGLVAEDVLGLASLATFRGGLAFAPGLLCFQVALGVFGEPTLFLSAGDQASPTPLHLDSFVTNGHDVFLQKG